MTPQTEPGRIIQHFKGGHYRVLFICQDAKTKHESVVYISCSDGQVWTRLRHEFEELVRWPDGVTRARFIVGYLTDPREKKKT